MATDSARRAITKALLLGGAEAVWRLRPGVYAVASVSRPGTVHTVTVEDGGYRCDCEAGRHERVCWHQAAAYIARVQHASKRRVTGAARPAPADPRAVPAAA